MIEQIKFMKAESPRKRKLLETKSKSVEISQEQIPLQNT